MCVYAYKPSGHCHCQPSVSVNVCGHSGVPCRFIIIMHVGYVCLRSMTHLDDTLNEIHVKGHGDEWDLQIESYCLLQGQ